MDSAARWATVCDYLIDALPGYATRVAVAGGDPERAALLAGHLAERLDTRGLGGITVATTAAGRDGADLSVWVRPPRGDGADAVVELSDPGWPVLRHLDERFAAGEVWYRSESAAFFAVRAAGWDAKWGSADLPLYAAAVADAGIAPGGTAVDVGCGTGRAFPALREAVGPGGVVLGVDLTAEMLRAARERAARCAAGLVLGDVRALPLGDGSVDALFAAGLVNHLPDAEAGLRELARVTRAGGVLVLFHPVGRAALAARHGRGLATDEPLAEPVLRATTARTGWCLTHYADGDERFYARAVRG